MNILITGGAGYIGCSLVETLTKEDKISGITVYDNMCRDNYNFLFNTKKFRKVEFIQGDILDSYRLSKALEGVSVVIHLAAHVAFPYNHLQNLQYEQINRWGTKNVVRTCETTKSVKRFFYLSSTTVYGFREDIEPSDEVQPDNAYAVSKYAAENYVRLFTGSYAILRSANVFGFNRCMRLDSVVNSFFFDAICKGKIFIYGDGQQMRPFVYLDNLINKIYHWVLIDECEEVSVDFSVSLNNLRDFLLTRSENLEYQYLNQNQVFPGQSFSGTMNLNLMNDLLNKFFDSMSSNLIIKNK